MNPDQLALWQRIQAHVLDDPQSPAPFSLRLAAENGWGPRFTRRAIEEYRRFAFLAVAAGHPVSPSDAVDQVWHLHLLYTRDYWDEFCPKTLGMALHHGPARGGVAEADKFADWYARTRESYRAFFGEPPVDLWPVQPMHPKTVRVDTTLNWIVPRPRVFERLTRWAAARWGGAADAGASPEAPATSAPIVRAAKDATILALLMALCASSRLEAATVAATQPWPFSLRGPEFLQFFSVFAVVVIGVALLMRFRLRQPANVESTELEPYEVAHLTGGPNRAFAAAVTTAAKRGLIDVGNATVRRTEAPLPAALPLLERAVCDAARADGTKLREVRRHAAEPLRLLYSGLVERRLVMDGPARFKATGIPFLIAAIVPVVGFIKIGIGLELGRPVNILIFLSIVGTAAALLFLLRPRLTRRGAATIEGLRDRNMALAQLKPAMVAGGGGATLVPMAIGLWGLGSLAGTDLERTKRELERGGTGDVGVGSACGSGDSSGGSSCGGGGGGGCGGCGGGGGD